MIFFLALPAICLISDTLSVRLISPSNLTKVEKINLLIFKFKPIPIASEAINTSYSLFGSLKRAACCLRASKKISVTPKLRNFI